MPGPGLGPVAAHDPHLVRAPVADVAADRTINSGGFPASGGGGASATMPTEPLVSTSSLRRRNTVARVISCSSSSSNAASSHCTLRPGRIVRTRIVSGSSGTGRSNSTVTRATKPAGPGIVQLAHVREQRARRAAVHRARIPGPAGERRRHVAITVALEQRAVRLDRIFGHGPGSYVVEYLRRPWPRDRNRATRAAGSSSARSR